MSESEKKFLYSNKYLQRTGQGQFWFRRNWQRRQQIAVKKQRKYANASKRRKNSCCATKAYLILTLKEMAYEILPQLQRQLGVLSLWMAYKTSGSILKSNHGECASFLRKLYFFKLFLRQEWQVKYVAIESRKSNVSFDKYLHSISRHSLTVQEVEGEKHC